MARIKYCCSTCRSENVLFDAYAVWNVETQEMELNSTHGNPFCEGECNGPCSVEAIEIDGGEAPASDHMEAAHG